jgi:outer membrane protein assembly factor BamB
MIIKRALLAIGALFLSAHCAFAACATKDVIFADEFNDTLGGWTQGPGIAIANGIATLSVRKGFGAKTMLNNSFVVRDGHICVVATFPNLEQARKSDAPSLGIVFGATDYGHYYAFQVSALGTYSLTRNNNDKPMQVIDWTKTPALKNGFGAQNQIEVTIDKGVATLFINGQKVGASRVQLPDGESQFGLLVGVNIVPDMDVPFQFRNLVVSRSTP